MTSSHVVLLSGIGKWKAAIGTCDPCSNEWGCCLWLTNFSLISKKKIYNCLGTCRFPFNWIPLEVTAIGSIQRWESLDQYLLQISWQEFQPHTDTPLLTRHHQVQMATLLFTMQEIYQSGLLSASLPIPKGIFSFMSLKTSHVNTYWEKKIDNLRRVK